MAKKTENKELYIGAELWVNEFRMTTKAWCQAVLYAGALYFAITLSWTFSTHFPRFALIYDVYFAEGGLDGFLSIIRNLPGFLQAHLRAASGAGHIFFAALPAWLLAPALIAFWKHHSVKVQKTEHLKGVQVLTITELKEAIGTKETNIKLKVAAEVPEEGRAYEPKEALTWPSTILGLPRFVETRNFALIGKAGSGKSTVLFQFADAILARKEAAFYHDPHGDFVSRFYDEARGDIIFNPFDSRFQGWTIFNDLKRVTDYDIIGNVIIPDPKGAADPYWFLAPRQIFTAILKAVVETEPRPLNRHIVNVLNSGGKGIKGYIQASSPDVANMHLADPQGKTAASLLSVLLAFTKPLEYLSDGPFSIVDYLANPNGRQVFVTNQADLKQALKPINTVFFELLGTRLLSMEPDESRRTWVVLDEVFALNKLKVIERLPVEGRKFGVSLILGAQDFSQGDDLYTPALRRSIFNSLGNVFYFAVQDTATAKEIADTIGGHEFSESSRTLSGGIADNKDGLSLTRQRKTENRVLPSEVAGLRVFEHFLKLDGYHYCRNVILPQDYSKVAATFVAAPGLDVDAVKVTATRPEGVRPKTGGLDQEVEQSQVEAETKANGVEGFDPALFDASDVISDPAPDHGPDHN